MTRIAFEESAGSDSKTKYIAEDCTKSAVYLYEGECLIFVNGDGEGWFMHPTASGGGEQLCDFDGGSPEQIVSGLDSGQLEPVDIKITYTKRKSL